MSYESLSQQLRPRLLLELGVLYVSLATQLYKSTQAPKYFGWNSARSESRPLIRRLGSGQKDCEKRLYNALRTLNRSGQLERAGHQVGCELHTVLRAAYA